MRLAVEIVSSELEIGEMNEKTAGITIAGLSFSCFGFLNGVLYLGSRHHMAIMQWLLENGWDWDKLMNAQQLWGWCNEGYNPSGKFVRLFLQTDAAKLDYALEDQLVNAFEQVSSQHTEIVSRGGATNEEYAPLYDNHYGDDGMNIDQGTIKVLPFTPVPSQKSPQVQSPIPKGTWSAEVENKAKTFYEGIKNITYNPEEDLRVWLQNNTHLVPSNIEALVYYLTLGKTSAWKESSFSKFVYDMQTGKINVSAADQETDLHHWDLLAAHGLDEDEIERHIMHGSPRFIFGEQHNEYPHIYAAAEISAPDKQKALDAYYDYMTAHGIQIEGAYEDIWSPELPTEEDEAIREAFEAGRRVVWLVDNRGLKISELGSNAHHVDLGWDGDEMAAGEILGTKQGVYLQILDLQPNVDFSDIIQLVEAQWNAEHPNMPIVKVKNLTQGKESARIAGSESWVPEGWSPIPTNFSQPKEEPPLEIGPDLVKTHDDLNGYQVYQMKSGEYPDHDAILVDRDNSRIILNYQGHHEPMLRQMQATGVEWPNGNMTTGHYRTSPSRTEHFVEGFGWHGDEGSKNEKDTVKEVLRNYYDVDRLSDLWDSSKVSSVQVQWIDTGSPPKKNDLLWKGIYDSEQDKLYMWQGLEPHHFTMLSSLYPETNHPEGGMTFGNSVGRFAFAAGAYHRISLIQWPNHDNTGQIQSVLEQALLQKWPEMAKETNFKKSKNRFMVRKDGSVIMGYYKSHFDLIEDNGCLQQALDFKEGIYDKLPYITGGFIDDDGNIDIIHSPGEEDFSPGEVARQVYEVAYDLGEFVNGEAIYRDWRNGKSNPTFIDLSIT